MQTVQLLFWIYIIQVLVPWFFSMFHLPYFCSVFHLRLSPMAFWGVEVKPGESYVYDPVDGNRRLHLSQATLGLGDWKHKCIVECRVGIEKAIFLCCLVPDKIDCCQLNIEFEESVPVVFSVIGSQSVHLSGYYLFNIYPHNKDESGEDIGSVDSERSVDSENNDDDKYGGSFIDDDDLQLEVFPSQDI